MLALAIFSVSTAAIAQDLAEDEVSSSFGNGDEEEGGDEDQAFLDGEQNEEEEMMAAPEEQKDTSRAEDPQKGYHGLGARFRWYFVPEWFVGMFNNDIRWNSGAKKRPMVNNVGAGIEYIYRKDAFDITAAVWWVGLGWDNEVYFKETGEEEQAYEAVTSNLSAVLITADFVWSSPIKDWFAITYGIGVGLGIPIGKIRRTEAVEIGGELVPCNGVGDPNDEWCEDDGQYNQAYEKLKVIPWINPLVGVRFKPHRHLAIYVDGGFLIGIQLGFRAAYIF